MKQLLRDIYRVHLTIDGTNYTLAAGTTDVNSNALSLVGYEGVAISCVLGTITATGSGTAKLQVSANGSSGWTDVSGSSQTWGDSDDDKILSWDLLEWDPDYPYIRVAFDRETANSVINCLIADLYMPRILPQSQSVAAGQHVRVPEFTQRAVTGTA